MEIIAQVPALASMTDEEVCQEIAKRVRAERLRRGLSQSEMSVLSRIPLRTYKRLEADGSGSISTFVAAMRATGRLLGLQLLLPHPELPERKNSLTDITKRRAPRKRQKPVEVK